MEDFDITFLKLEKLFSEKLGLKYGNGFTIEEVNEEFTEYTLLAEYIEEETIEKILTNTKEKWEMCTHCINLFVHVRFKHNGWELEIEEKTYDMFYIEAFNYIEKFKFDSFTLNKISEIKNRKENRIRKIVNKNYYIDYDEFLNDDELNQVVKDMETLLEKSLNEIKLELNDYLKGIQKKIKRIAFEE